MPHQYSAENHDWDLTLRAAWGLLIAGQVPDQVETPYSPNEKEFACFTGSMLLSFCAIESFSASVAFSMEREPRFMGFDFGGYRKERRFWPKIELIFDAIPHKVDKSRGLFQEIDRMQDWRNLVTHASPYEVAKTPIANTTEAPTRLHAPFRHKEYARRVTLSAAQLFYATALDYIELLQGLTGINPRASATYVIGE